MAILTPTNLETADYGTVGWNAIYSSNFQKLNDYFKLFPILWQINNYNLSDGDIPVFNATTGQWDNKINIDDLVLQSEFSSWKANVNNQLTDHETRITNNESNIANHETRITNNENNIQEVNEKIRNQSFINLIRNGNFTSWSQGDSSYPDKWYVYSCSIQRITVDSDNSLGHDFVRLTTDASGNKAFIRQLISESDLMQYLLNVGNAQKLTIVMKAKVRTDSDKVYLANIASGTPPVYHSGSGEWEELILVDTFTGSEYTVGALIGVLNTDNTANITFDVGEVSLYIGELPILFQENPLDRAIEAGYYKDSNDVNYEYKCIREECGRTYCQYYDSYCLTKTIAFAKPFRKVLGVYVTKGTDRVIGGVSNSSEWIKVTTGVGGVTNSGATLYVCHSDGVFVEGDVCEVYWRVIGVG